MVVSQERERRAAAALARISSSNLNTIDQQLESTSLNRNPETEVNETDESVHNDDSEVSATQNLSIPRFEMFKKTGMVTDPLPPANMAELATILRIVNLEQRCAAQQPA